MAELAVGHAETVEVPDLASCPTLVPAAPNIAAAPDAPAGELLGGGATRLGHYALLHELGRGGMSVVYAAYDEKLDRKVAIKVLHARGDPWAQRRLLREAQALAQLSHSNVVQIYEIGDLDGQAFLAMEFIDGITLRRWCSEQPRSRAELLAVFTAAGRGLAAAHVKGLIHRDFKPDNVMIHRDGRVLVTDFGLVRGAGPNESLRISASSGVLQMASPRSAR
ncbi:serine/threonine-protein kinase [Nannocystis sp.]|uniref:serine/threonine-protein kinase n=1 Tax=Nannocystis sp. TaxID=1962667 RepID=UPI0025D9D86F|nr:serine/threonine-protein kinase [Nannocystis sp.]MBK7823622.1 serine/threonine protein kinase [Nannocystis sp.]